MFEALNITAADAEGIAEIAALDLAMAKDFAARAQAAEDPDVANAYVRSYQRCARSYRQSVLAKARLQRELQRIAVDAPAPDPAKLPPYKPVTPTRCAQIDERHEDVYEAVSRVAWAEVDDPEDLELENDGAWPDYFSKLLPWLTHRMTQPGFMDGGLDDRVAEVCRDLGFDPALAARWRELPPFPEAVMFPPKPQTPAAPATPRLPPNTVGAVWTYPAGWKPGRGMRVECESFDTREPEPPP